MQDHFLIAIDSGKSFTKYVSRNTEGIIEKEKFRTKVAEIQGFSNDLSPQSDLVHYDGKTMVVGDSLSEDYTNYDLTKQTHEHRICIYLAIAKVLKKLDNPAPLANIHLSVNTPLPLFRNENAKKAYSQFIQQDGKIIGIEVNNKPFSFRIASIVVLPESIGPLFFNINAFRNMRTLMVDIGSLNVHFLETDNITPKFDKVATATQGIHILRAKIAEALTTKYGVAFFDDDVDQVLRDKCIYLNGQKQEDSQQWIEELIMDHVKQIFNYAKSRKISISSMQNIVIFGGGSLLLKPYLLQLYPSATIYPDGEYANALSFFRILEAKQSEKRKQK